MPLLDRQRKVNDMLADYLRDGRLHSVRMKCWTPAQWERHGRPQTYPSDKPAAPAGSSPPQAARAPSTDAADKPLKEVVAQVLAEFVQSEYMLNMCRFCSVNPTECGQVAGTFESVRLVDTTLHVKLTVTYTQKSKQLLDRLAEHLRASVPQITRMQYSIGGSWGQTRTWVL